MSALAPWSPYPLLPKSVASATSGWSAQAIDVVGHSYAAAGGSSFGDVNGYVDRLANMLGARTRRNLAIGGAVSFWPTAGASGDGGWSWVLNQFGVPTAPGAPYLPQTTVAVPHFGLDGLAEVGSNVPGPFQEAMRAICSRLCATALFPINGSAWALGSGMTTVTSLANTYGGPMAYAQTSSPNPATMNATFTVPADYPGNQIIAVALALTGAVQTPNNGQNIVVGLTIDGVAQSNVTLDDSAITDPINGKTNIKVLRIGRSDQGLGIALAAGTHTIEVSFVSTNIATSPYFIVLGSWIESNPLDGPVLLVPNLNRPYAYTLWNAFPRGPSAGTNPMNDASVAAFNVALESVLSDFPNRAVYVDIDTALGKNANYFAADQAHPNNWGHAIIAQTMQQALFSSGLITPRLLSAATWTDSERQYWDPIGGAYGVTSAGVAFSNSWVNYGSIYAPAAVSKDLAGMIRLRGAVTKTTGNATDVIFTLPAGYRPLYNREFVTTVYNGSAWGTGILTVGSNGAVSFTQGGSIAAGNANFLEAQFVAEQ